MARWKLPHLPRPLSPLQNTTESPTSPASPLSPLPSTSPSSPNSSNPPVSPSTLTAPSRLHLRTLLPSPPLLSSAPPLPYPWIWRCHLCGNIYQLGTTRRCLWDGHYFCSLPSPPASPTSTSTSLSLSLSHQRDEETSLGKGFETSSNAARRRELEYKEKRRKRKGVVRGCRAEFDYTGWSNYNIWRREVRTIKYNRKLDSGHRIKEARHWESSPITGLSRGDAQGDADGGEAEKDCWRDCDFPSECLNERKAEREWGAYREKMRVLEEEWALQRKQLQSELLGETVEMDVDVDSARFYDAREEVDVADGNEKMEVEMEEKEKVDEHDSEAMGPMGIDCDGLGEEGYQLEYTKSRRKSLDAAAESPPSSPLKSCSFGFEDVDMGCHVWAQEEKGEGGEGKNMQIEEVPVKGGSLFLRVREGR